MPKSNYELLGTGEVTSNKTVLGSEIRFMGPRDTSWITSHIARSQQDQFHEYRTIEDAGNSYIEIRFPILPTPENLAKAYDAVLPILGAKVRNWKMLNIHAQDAETTWNPEYGRMPFDQRGKELCIYVSWEMKNGRPIKSELAPQEYRSLLLDLLDAMIKAGVQGIGYKPSKAIDRSLSEPGIPTLCTYTNFTSYRKGFRTFEPEQAGYQDPLARVRLSRNDLLSIGLNNEELKKIARYQYDYTIEHHLSAIGYLRSEIDQFTPEMSTQPVDEMDANLDEDEKKALSARKEAEKQNQVKQFNLITDRLTLTPEQQITLRNIAKQNSDKFEMLSQAVSFLERNVLAAETFDCKNHFDPFPVAFLDPLSKWLQARKVFSFVLAILTLPTIVGPILIASAYFRKTEYTKNLAKHGELLKTLEKNPEKFAPVWKQNESNIISDLGPLHTSMAKLSGDAVRNVTLTQTQEAVAKKEQATPQLH